MRKLGLVLLTSLVLGVAPVSAEETGPTPTHPVVTALWGAPAPASANAAASFGAASLPGAPAGTLTETPCGLLPDGATASDVRCGYVAVPLEHDEPDGETISLAVAVSLATGPAPAADPLLVLAGGPGEYLVSAFSALVGDGAPLAPVNVTRDVILLDQRGVGFGRPALDCPETLELTDLDSDDFAAALGACRDRLVAGGIELSAFDTENDVADLELVRTALGYPTWNVFGTSYGARLALQAGRASIDTIRSQVLSSPVPAERNFIAEAGPSFQAALDRLGALCSADAACRGTVGDGLVATVDRVVDRLLAMPARSDVTDPSTGQPVTIPVTADLFANVLFSLFYSAGILPFVPALVAGADAGNYRLLLEGTFGQGLISSQGQQLSFICAEEIDRSSPEEVATRARGLSRGPQVFIDSNPVAGLPVFDICEDWDVAAANPITFTRVTTGPPTLVVTGALDQITPPSYGEEVVAALPDAFLVEAPSQGHSPLLGLGDCGVGLLVAFLDDLTAAPAPSCATAPLVIEPSLPAVALPRAISDACPPALVPAPAARDVERTGAHAPSIACMLWWGVASGFPDGTFRAGEPTSRGQLATFLARLLDAAGVDLPEAPPGAFADDDGSGHEQAIDALAALGVVAGRSDGTFGPHEPVTRGQAATLLTRALAAATGAPLSSPDVDFFSDDTGSVHEGAINTIAGVGLTGGLDGSAFGPAEALGRGQMATVLARALDLLHEGGRGVLPRA